MRKMARAHTSGQHALCNTIVEPGQLDAALWRLRHGPHRRVALQPGRGLGIAVSSRLAAWKLDGACGATPNPSCSLDLSLPSPIHLRR